MKKILLMFAMLIVSTMAFAQVPYYAGTPSGNYFYSSVKFRASDDMRFENYTTYQRGIGNHFAVGADFYAGYNSMYIGYLVRFNAIKTSQFSFGGQVTPSFDLKDGHKFSYLTTGLFFNGYITSTVHWVDNTWITINKDGSTSVRNWLYVADTYKLNDNNYITPMVGFFNNLFSSEIKPDVSVGAYWTYKSLFDVYLWSDNMLSGEPRIVLGMDFMF